MRNVLISAPVLIALAACGTPEAEPEPAETEMASPGALRPGGAAGAPSPQGNDGPSGETVELDAMPGEFIGSWNFAEEDCGSGEGQMRIYSDRTEFYESVGTYTAIRQTGARTIIATHDTEGEGERWQEDLAYELNEAGDRLTTTMPEGSSSIRVRCP